MTNSTKITVFTPTYNRGRHLLALYESLRLQTYSEFEWIVIDDGSTDGTNEIVNTLIDMKSISIKYFYKKNAGKHVAINLGVQMASGELFFIVDSDDLLPATSLQSIIKYYREIQFNDRVGGIVGRKGYFDGQVVGSTLPFNSMLSNPIDIRHKFNVEGDLAEVFKTSVLAEFPLPVYSNETFCPEVLIWNRIGMKYDLLYYNELVYFCEYLPDGLTAQIVNIRMKSPRASMVTYSELCNKNIPVVNRLKCVINFWRFSFNSNMKYLEKRRLVPSLFSVLALPIGYLMYLNDKIRTNESTSGN